MTAPLASRDSVLTIQKIVKTIPSLEFKQKPPWDLYEAFLKMRTYLGMQLSKTKASDKKPYNFLSLMLKSIHIFLFIDKLCH